jgi:tetratricopeptide (TPR) repeat protein
MAGAILSLVFCLATPVAAQRVEDLNGVQQLHQAGKYAEATLLAQQVVALREKELGPDHPDIVWVLMQLAELYREQGRLADAEVLYRRSLAIRENAFGADHLRVGQSLGDLGALYIVQGRYADAETLLSRARAILEQTGPAPPGLPAVLKHLSYLYANRGRVSDAEALLQRALAMRQIAFGPEHQLVAFILNDLALLYAGQGRLADAEALYQRALAIEEKTLGPNHPETAIVLDNLGALRGKQGRYAAGEVFVKRALAIKEKRFGLHHPSVAITVHLLAELYRWEGRLEESARLDERAAAIREQTLKPDTSAISLSWPPTGGEIAGPLAAGSFVAQDGLAQVESLIKRALAIQEKSFSPDYADVLTSLRHYTPGLNNLAEVYRTRGRYTEALAVVQIAIRNGPSPPRRCPSSAVGGARSGVRFHWQRAGRRTQRYAASLAEFDTRGRCEARGPPCRRGRPVGPADPSGPGFERRGEGAR